MRADAATSGTSLRTSLDLPFIRESAGARGKDAMRLELHWSQVNTLTAAQATEPERVRSACLAAGLVAHVLGSDGALFTKIGGVAPHVDMAQAAAQCGALGVKTTLIVEDMSTDGSQEGMLLFNFPGLHALVNVGSGQERVTLPAMERVIGADDLVPALQSSVQTTYGSICGAIEQIGASRLTALVQ